MAWSLSYEEMISYLGGNTVARNIIEGEEVLKAGLVVVVGTRGKTEDKVEVMGLVLQTSGLTKEPVQVTGLLSFDEDNRLSVRKMSCTCKAGMSERCKHVGAVLWYLNR
jgi:uncharacterized Zn finger protein